MRLAATSIIVLIGCGSSAGGDSGQLGSVAFSKSGTGELVVQEVAGGVPRSVDDTGPFGTISFSPDGTELSYVNGSREVFIATLNGDIRAVGETGWYMPSLQWEVGGWLWFPEGTSSRSSTIIVPPGSADSRQLGSPRYVPVAGSPVEPRLAFLECNETPPLSCDLVVERLDGSERVALATDIIAAGVQFTPDGTRVVIAEQRGDEFRAIARPTDGAGSDLDLGLADGTMYESGAPPGLSLFSPDGSELLSMDGSKLLALRLDGTGARPVAEPGPTHPWHAGFTPAGDVLFMQVTNTEDPPDDTPQFAYTIRLAEPNGTVRTLRDLDPHCSIAMSSSTVATVSSDGSLLAYDCGIVQRISDGEIIAELSSGGRPLGFTPDGGTLFLAGTRLVLVASDGQAQDLGETFGLENRDVEGLQAAYHLDPTF